MECSANEADLHSCDFLLWYCFEILCLCQPPWKLTRFEGQHPREEFANIHSDTLVAIINKRRKSVYAVYGQWGVTYRKVLETE